MFGMNAARAVEKLGRRIKAPLRVVLWDGRDFALSDAPRTTLRVNHPGAALALRNPSLLSLAEAYIAGDIDIEGDLRSAVRAATALARPGGDGFFARRSPGRTRH